MAWYALYKWFADWRKTPYENMILWYKDFLYQEWYNSLSDEDKKKEEQRISDLNVKRLEHLEQIYSMVNRMSGDQARDYMKMIRDKDNRCIQPSKYR